jgi:2-haloacid dehalogenase
VASKKEPGKTETPSVPTGRGPIRALVFDAYGTLFDVYSVTSLCEELFPGSGIALAVMWRAKQLQYSLLRSMMDRYKDFWEITDDGLVYSAHILKLDLTAERRV